MVNRMAGYVVVWEFRVRKGAVKRFEKVYGPAGDWAKLFRRGRGYVRTELVRDPSEPWRFLTLDFWTSKSAYMTFRDRHKREYEAIDRKCGDLTDDETRIGEFESI